MVLLHSKNSLLFYETTTLGETESSHSKESFKEFQYAVFMFYAQQLFFYITLHFPFSMTIYFGWSDEAKFSKKYSDINCVVEMKRKRDIQGMYKLCVTAQNALQWAQDNLYCIFLVFQPPKWWFFFCLFLCCSLINILILTAPDVCLAREVGYQMKHLFQC